MTARKILLAVLLLAAAPVQPAAAEAPITVRGGLHKDYVRMVFDWPKTVKYSARIEVGRLVVVFPPGHSFDFKPARGILRKHLQLPDGVIADRRAGTGEIDRFNDAIGLKRVAHFPDLDVIRRSRLKKATLFEMELSPELEAVQQEYLRLAAALWAGTEALDATPMKDREIFDFLGFD